MITKKKIGVIGATGYTGSELVRILKYHPEIEISIITSESRAGEKFSDVHPFFQGIVDDELHSADKVDDMELDLVFLALPHGVSMDYVKRWKDKSFKTVDLSGDFRLDSPEIYEEWYKKDHTFREGFQDAAYGLPELYSSKIKTAKLVANPGCFPTGSILALAPVVSKEMINAKNIIIDAKTGVTGAGIKANAVTHYSNASDNFKAYGLKFHRHSIEIQSNLEKSGRMEPNIQFTPHLLPVDRGILTTAYSQASKPTSQQELQKLYEEFYQNMPFVRIVSKPPSIKDVRASNYCNIYVDYDERTNNVIVISVIDNLVKGAAGQAVQNMNLLFGFDETLGLNHIPINP